MIEFIDLSAVGNWSLSHSDMENIGPGDNLNLQSTKSIEQIKIRALNEFAFDMARLYHIIPGEHHYNILISEIKDDVLKYPDITEADIIII